MHSIQAVVIILALVLSGTSHAADWVIGAVDPNETILLTTDLVVNGDLILQNNGHLDLQSATLTVSGEILVYNTAQLTSTGGTILFSQAYAYQSGIGIFDTGALQCVDTLIDGGGYAYSIALMGNAAATYTRVTVENGFSTWVLNDSSTVTLSECANTGEFVPFGQPTLSISNSDTVLFWMSLPDGSVVDVTLPTPGAVANWSMGPTSPWASGILYDVQINTCTNVLWGVNATSGCNGTFRDSALRVVGSLFNRANTITINGVANNSYLADTSYAWGDVAIRFINTSVQTWNFYCFGSTMLTLQNCLFGELFVDEYGQTVMMQSLCDGSGGYVNVKGFGVLQMILSTALSQLSVHDSGMLFTIHSSLLSPEIHATGGSVMTLQNTLYVGEPNAYDSATIIDVSVDPVSATVGEAVSIQGSARMITGSTSPFSFQDYSLFYGSGNQPTAWTPIGGSYSTQVHQGILGSWDTCSLPTGEYSFKVSLLPSPSTGPPIEATRTTVLTDGFACTLADCAPVGGNGMVNIDDLVAVLNAFGSGGGPCDIAPINIDCITGNGVVNIDDLVAVLNSFGLCP